LKQRVSIGNIPFWYNYCVVSRGPHTPVKKVGELEYVGGLFTLHASSLWVRARVCICLYFCVFELQTVSIWQIIPMLIRLSWTCRE